MPRVKKGTTRAKKRKAILKQTKGYKWGRKNLTKASKTASKKAGVYAFRDRRNKKRTARRLWQVQLNATLKEFDLNYSKFINLLKINKIELDRKILAEIAQKNPEIFANIVKSIKK